MGQKNNTYKLMKGSIDCNVAKTSALTCYKKVKCFGFTESYSHIIYLNTFNSITTDTMENYYLNTLAISYRNKVKDLLPIIGSQFGLHNFTILKMRRRINAICCKLDIYENDGYSLGIEIFKLIFKLVNGPMRIVTKFGDNELILRHCTLGMEIDDNVLIKCENQFEEYLSNGNIYNQELFAKPTGLFLLTYELTLMEE
ncbi:hypothetical protein SNEBB_006921 [Seison nebaliae]|nr:hypothetical protein SNEBB_006921 [Seison nebaliae]